MGSHQFDKHIKDKLQFHKMDIPEGMWEKIEAGLPRKDKNRGMPLLGLTAVASALFLFLLSAYYITRDTTRILPLKKADTDTFSPGALPASAMANPREYTARIPENETTGKQSNHQALPDLKKPNTSFRRGVQNVTFVASSQNAADSGIHTTLENNPGLSVSVSEPVTAEKTGTFHSSPDGIAAIDRLENKKNYIFGKGATRKYHPKDECLSNFDKSGKGIFMDVYYGHDLPIRSMKARNNQFTKLAQARAETETPLYSFSLGARLGFNLNKNLNLLTGVHYSRINEKFEFVDPESSQTKVVKTTLYIKDGQGNIKDSTFTFDTIFIPGTLVYKIRNQYTSLDIPFLIGYRFLHGEKLSVTLNAGIMANLLFTQEGMALMQDQFTARSFDNENSNNFHHSLGFSTFASAQFLYALVPDLHLFLEPSIRFQHRDMTTKDYPISQHYTTISFLTGARYYF